MKTFRLIQARRDDNRGRTETLNFEAGVNVIVGEPNTGKSKWCRTIDFVLGDKKSAEEKLGATLAAKYVRASIKMKIGDEEFTAERRWHEAGAKGKVFVGDREYYAADFAQLLLDKLGIPSVHYPQGNPYGPRTWPELGFRSLLRHMYRRQKPWGNIADGQYPSEQHACIMQFFGIGKDLFSDEYGEMIQKEKMINDLKLKKEQFLTTLFEVSKEIVDQQDISTSITPEAIEEATERLNRELVDLNAARIQILTSLIGDNSLESSAENGDTISIRSREYAELKAIERFHTGELEKVRVRLVELEKLEGQIVSEHSRLERARDAGECLADLKATHCPVCDQYVKKSAGDAHCYLCHQSMPEGGQAGAESLHRLSFELDQLKASRKEVAELISQLKSVGETHQDAIRSLRSRAGRVAETLRPERMAIAAVLPPEVAEIEMEVGRRLERIEQLNRIRESFHKQSLITAQIAEIQKRVDDLEIEVEKRNSALDFETPSDQMSNGMNDYTRNLLIQKEHMWKQQPIRFRLSKHDIRIRVGNHKWDDQLGETNTIYFLLAYHYALLASSVAENSRYPQFLMFELPGEVEGKKVADKENFVIEPFIELCKRTGFEEAQVIATGSSFQGLKGAHRIELAEVWVGAPGQAPEPEDMD